MHKLIGWLLGLLVFGLLIGGAFGQDGPLRNAANTLVRTESNGYLIVAPQTYGGPDGPLQTFANTLVRTDTNGYLIVTNPTGFVTATTCTNQFVRAIATSGAATCASVSLTADVTGDLPFANVVQIATASVLGRNTAGTGDIEVLAQAALTKADDTNVTLTLGGSPTVALVNAASITAGWTGQLAVSRGGTALSTFGGTNTLLYTTATDALSSIATANDGVLITSGTGVPSISSTLPTAVQDNITRVGTLAAGAVPASLVTAGTFGAGAYVMGTSLSTPSLLSTGALTVTPAAGSNLNVALSTTGVFAVNTNQLYVDTSTGHVGMGIAPSGSYKLHVFSSNVAALQSLMESSVAAQTVNFTFIARDSDTTQRTTQFGLGLFADNAFSISNGMSEWQRITLSTGATRFLGPSVTIDEELVVSGTGNSSFVSNVGLGTLAFPSAGTAGLVFGDGTALSGMGTNTAGLYADNVGTTVEMFAIDELGAATQISPHNFTLFAPDASEEYPASYYSKNHYLGVEVAIDLFRLARLVQQQTGVQLIHRRALPTRRDWVDDQDANMRRAMANYEQWEGCEPTLERECGAAPPYPIVKRPPTWMEDRLRAKGWLNTVKAQALRDDLRGWCTARGLSFAGGTCA